MEKNTDIYKMKLNDEIEILSTSCSEQKYLRVPGGWVFTECTYGDVEVWTQSSVFIPWDNEFLD